MICPILSFCNEHGCMTEQHVEYEWRPIQCSKYSSFGHVGEQCRKNGVKKFWVQKKQAKDSEEF